MAKKSGVSKFMRDFISEENRNYKLHIGSTVASSLAGIVCGVIIASIVWYIALKYIIDVAGFCIK